MRIGIVTAWFSSGAGMVSKNYEQTFQKKHDVFIFCRGGSAKCDSKWNGENVTWSKPRPSSTGICKNQLKKWIKSNHIEIILFNEQRNWKPVLFAKKLGIKIGAYIDYYTADTVPFFYLYDFLICNTKRHYSVFKDHPQSCFCPWGTQINTYKPLKYRPDRTITFLISAGTGGAIGALDRRGAGMAMNIFSKVKGDCCLVVYSQVPLEQCPDHWKSIVSEDKRIDFRVGTFTPVPYNEGDVYVYPSRLDGIGLTLPEALSSGLAAITTNSPPMTEFVKNFENGRLINVKELHGRPDGYYWPESIINEESLKEAFQYYINNPNEVTRHGSNARSLAEKNLSWEKNSGFLNDWICSIKRISNQSDDTINGVKLRKVKWYDRNYNPTPFERILIGIKLLIRQIILFLHLRDN